MYTATKFLILKTLLENKQTKMQKKRIKKKTQQNMFLSLIAFRFYIPNILLGIITVVLYHPLIFLTKRFSWFWPLCNETFINLYTLTLLLGLFSTCLVFYTKLSCFYEYVMKVFVPICKAYSHTIDMIYCKPD